MATRERMRRTRVLALVVLALAACEETRPTPSGRSHPQPRPPSSPTTSSASRVATTAALPDAASAPVEELAEGEGRLGFRITAIYPRERPENARPWHAPGGNFTFFDAALKGDDQPSITIGVHIAPTQGPGGGGDATIQAVDASRGAKFVARLAAAFGAKNPAVERRKLGDFAWPLPFMIRGIGLGSVNSPIGATPAPGGWVSTKWFVARPPPHDALSVELYVDFDLGARRGELVLRDESEAEELMATFAVWLRDGPAPKLTVEPTGAP
ncbi:MAG: hypothetical protein IT373_28410 [Polyangiaceae bacterium]|nr:hypothetical protein [Polyangiaceae bacterium]